MPGNVGGCAYSCRRGRCVVQWVTSVVGELADAGTLAAEARLKVGPVFFSETQGRGEDFFSTGYIFLKTGARKKPLSKNA